VKYRALRQHLLCYLLVHLLHRHDHVVLRSSEEDSPEALHVFLVDYSAEIVEHRIALQICIKKIGVATVEIGLEIALLVSRLLAQQPVFLILHLLKVAFVLLVALRLSFHLALDLFYE
jgi:hypothetical protein